MPSYQKRRRPEAHINGTGGGGGEPKGLFKGNTFACAGLDSIFETVPLQPWHSNQVREPAT